MANERKVTKMKTSRGTIYIIPSNVLRPESKLTPQQRERLERIWEERKKEAQKYAEWWNGH